MSQTLLKILADFDTQLAAPVSIGDTTATLVSATDDDGVTLPTGLYGLTIDAGNSSKEYIVCTVTSTAITAVYSISRQGVSTSGFARGHRRGAKVTLTDWAILSRMLNNLNGTTGFDSGTNLGYDGSPTGLTGNQFATVNYVLSVVNGGTVTFDQQIVGNQTSGESLAINDLVYFKESDQKWYKVDADLTTTFDQLQLGFNKTTAGASGVTIQVAISGPVSGFTSLTAGSKYYASNTAGSITTTPGTYSVFIGWALNTTQILFNPIMKTLPTQNEKSAMAGGSTFGTPSSTNKFITQDYNSSATGLPVVNLYDTVSTEIGGSTTQFDITNTSGNTYRYTYDGTGTDPNISLANNPVGSLINFQAQNFTAANNGVFIVTAAGSNYVEVTNASGVAENNKTIGTGYVVRGTSTWTKPTGLKYITVEVQGGGGGGGSTTTASVVASGGGGGGYTKKIIATSALNSTEYFLIGNFGTGGNGTGGDGTSGKESAFSSSLLYATGGTFGRGNGNNGGIGGRGFNGTINIGGQGGGASGTSTSGGSGMGGSSFLGGGGQGYLAGTDSNSGGVGLNPGTGYGGGGGGASTSGPDAVGGVGTKGCVIITEYYS